MDTVRRKQGRAKMDVLAVAQKFCAGWTSLDAQAFSVLFAPEGSYTDIAFGITRRGRDQVPGTSSDLANRRAGIRDVE